MYKRLLILTSLLAMLLAAPAYAFDSFQVQDIRVNGLKRLGLGTVLTYLPFAIGDTLDETKARQGIRALYDTGLFKNVSFGRDGQVLVIDVTERPYIAKFTLTGNEKLGKDKLKDGLAKSGLAQGEVYRRDLLDQVELELKRQYYAHGYYAVRIDTEVKPAGKGQVDVSITIHEGPAAKIKSINLVGNKIFSADELTDDFEQEPTRAFSLFQSTDQYSKEKLVGDLEKLSSYYQDRGYLRFQVTSVQVSLSQDRRDIFITINMEEGDVYKVSGISLSGKTILPKEYLRKFISIHKGDIFSRKQATDSADRISKRLADNGFAFAKVVPKPNINDAAHTVALNFNVQSKNRVYVRDINFLGNVATNDETLRREMRQLEGASFSRAAVQRSRERLQRLPYIKSADVETQKVPGSNDLVDLDFSVEERPSGSIQAGVGYSGASGFLINGSVTNTNFRGTGQRVSVKAEYNQFSKLISGSWTDPYATDDGVSRTLSAYYRSSEQVVRYSSGFDTDAVGGSLTYGLPLSEYTSLRLGGGVDVTSVTAFRNITADEILRFLLDNGTRFVNYEFRTGIVRDTRNRTIFPSRGMYDALTFDITLPGSDLKFYRSRFRHQQFIPLISGFALEIKGDLGYADGYGKDKDIPPYENYFAGGFESVRGYRDGTAGPRDHPFGNPFGGKLLVSLQNELIVPIPFLESDGKTTRLSLFYDVGSTYADLDAFEADQLRTSAGVAVYWYTPFFGLLKMSYAFPLEYQPQDELDRFQLSFGVGF